MNKKAYYGAFGGQFVAESLMNTLEELDVAFEEAIHDPKFMEQYHYYLSQYVGRETPLYYAERLSEKYGTKIYLKRELLYMKNMQEKYENNKRIKKNISCRIINSMHDYDVGLHCPYRRRLKHYKI